MNVIVNLRGRPFTITFERDKNSPNFKAFPQGKGAALKATTNWLAEQLPGTATDAEAGYFKVTHSQALKLISLLMETPASEGETIR